MQLCLLIHIHETDAFSLAKHIVKWDLHKHAPARYSSDGFHGAIGFVVFALSVAVHWIRIQPSVSVSTEYVATQETTIAGDAAASLSLSLCLSHLHTLFLSLACFLLTLIHTDMLSLPHRSGMDTLSPPLLFTVEQRFRRVWLLKPPKSYF